MGNPPYVYYRLQKSQWVDFLTLLKSERSCVLRKNIVTQLLLYQEASNKMNASMCILFTTKCVEINLFCYHQSCVEPAYSCSLGVLRCDAMLIRGSDITYICHMSVCDMTVCLCNTVSVLYAFFRPSLQCLNPEKCSNLSSTFLFLKNITKFLRCYMPARRWVGQTVICS